MIEVKVPLTGTQKVAVVLMNMDRQRASEVMKQFTEAEAADLCGAESFAAARDAALRLYAFASSYAEQRGIVLADTKFEFGVDATGELLLIDEALTPDSSRFWEAGSYEPGRPQASFDKQFVRDWLETQPWDKTDPGPALPDEVIAGTRARYIEAYERIAGASFERYLQEDSIAS